MQRYQQRCQQSLTLTATWTVNQYTITLIVMVVMVRSHRLDAITAPENPSKEGIPSVDGMQRYQQRCQQRVSP